MNDLFVKIYKYYNDIERGIFFLALKKYLQKKITLFFYIPIGLLFLACFSKLYFQDVDFSLLRFSLVISFFSGLIAMLGFPTILSIKEFSMSETIARVNIKYGGNFQDASSAKSLNEKMEIYNQADLLF